MPAYSILLELDVQLRSADEYQALVLRWLDEGSRVLAPDVRAALDTVDLPSEIPQSGDDPYGPPNSPWGRFYISTDRPAGPPRGSGRPVGAKGWAWLRRQLATPKANAMIQLLRHGPDGSLASSVYLQAHGGAMSPGWVRLTTTRSSDTFPAEEGLWTGFLRSWAEEVNPSYGQIGIGHAMDRTTLETRLPNDFGRNSPPNTVIESPQFLRGYTWITVIADELARRLGGLDGIRATGAFAEVAQLGNGGVWLRSTDRFESYDQAAAERVFDALAPVIRPGKPEPRTFVPGTRVFRDGDGDTPYLLVYEDAAKRRES